MSAAGINECVLSLADAASSLKTTSVWQQMLLLSSQDEAAVPLSTQ